MILCVTGRMAAGKNAASEILVRRGFCCVDCDRVVHEILAEPSFQRRVADEFAAEADAAGIALVRADGSLDRRALGSLLFRDGALLARQESLVLPEVESRVRVFLGGGGDRVVNAAVLWKLPGTLALCDAVIFVDAPWFVRFARARRRDGIPRLDIARRFWAQRNLFAKYRLENADTYRVQNAGDLRALESKIDGILGSIEKKQRGKI